MCSRMLIFFALKGGSVSCASAVPFGTRCCTVLFRRISSRWQVRAKQLERRVLNRSVVSVPPHADCSRDYPCCCPSLHVHVSDARSQKCFVRLVRRSGPFVAGTSLGIPQSRSHSPRCVPANCWSGGRGKWPTRCGKRHIVAGSVNGNTQGGGTSGKLVGDSTSRGASDGTLFRLSMSLALARLRRKVRVGKFRMRPRPHWRPRIDSWKSTP